jgi:hypothetical protein
MSTETSERATRGQRGTRGLLSARGIAFFAACALFGTACGNGTGPAGGDAGDGGRPPDALTPPNSQLCRYINAADGGTLRFIENQPTTAQLASIILCHPNMRAGDPCVAWGGGPGVCRDFDFESSGRFSEFTRFNRVALYCRRPGDYPCSGVAVGVESVAATCDDWGNCAPVPNPLPGRPTHVCFPPACN